MPLPVIADVYRCAINWNAAGQHAVNVLHVSAPSSTENDVAAALSDAASPAMFDGVSESADAATVDIILLDGSAATVTLALTDWVGSGGSDFIPGASGLVKLQTGLRGPRHRGRIYLPFAAESGQSDGRWTGDTLTAPQAAWEGFLASLVGAGMELVVASYAHADANPVTVVTWEPALATQRRRQTRVRLG